MNELEKAQESAKAFAKLHLKECCQEMVEWSRTGLLIDGKIRELARICALLNLSQALRIAQTYVSEAAYHLIAEENK